MKKSLDRLNSELTSYVSNKSILNKKYSVNCRGCKQDFEFTEKDLKDKIYKCPHCGKEEIFFRYNFS